VNLAQKLVIALFVPAIVYTFVHVRADSHSNSANLNRGLTMVNATIDHYNQADRIKIVDTMMEKSKKESGAFDMQNTWQIWAITLVLVGAFEVWLFRDPK